MSTDYTAYAVIGVEVSAEKLYKVTMQRHLAHPVEDNWKVCPICGKDAFYPLVTVAFDEDENRLGKFTVARYSDNGRIIIGLAVEDNGRRSQLNATYFQSIPNLEELKDELRAVLKPLDAWDESMFGLHVLLRTSW